MKTTLGFGRFSGFGPRGQTAKEKKKKLLAIFSASWSSLSKFWVKCNLTLKRFVLLVYHGQWRSKSLKLVRPEKKKCCNSFRNYGRKYFCHRNREVGRDQNFGRCAHWKRDTKEKKLSTWSSQEALKLGRNFLLLNPTRIWNCDVDNFTFSKFHLRMRVKCHKFFEWYILCSYSYEMACYGENWQRRGKNWDDVYSITNFHLKKKSLECPEIFS